MSPEWTAIKHFAASKIEVAQKELLNCPLDQVERVRGRVEAYRTILALEGAPADTRRAAAFINEPG